MDISKHVVSLDLSRKLKELGVKQSSFFYWMPDGKIRYGFEMLQDDKGDAVWPISAFLASELGEILKKRYQPYLSHIDPLTVWVGVWAVYDKGTLLVSANTEADARAKLLIHLIEQKIVDPTTL